MSSNDNNLKRLGAVPELSTKAGSAAATAYTSVKNYVPGSLKEPVEKLETKIAEVAAPLVVAAQDKGSDLLKVVDNQVDKAVHNVATAYEKNSGYLTQQLDSVSEYNKKNLASFQATREEYVAKVTESVDFLKKNGVTAAAKRAVEEVSAALDEAKKLPGTVTTAVIGRVHDAWERLISFEAVQKTLGATRPAVDAAWARYCTVHDNVVASPMYKKAFDQAASVVTTAQGTVFYRKAKENIYDQYLSKYANPAIGQIMEHPYYKTLVEQIVPKTEA